MARFFESATDRVEFPSFTPTDVMTVCAWVKSPGGGGNSFPRAVEIDTKVVCNFNGSADTALQTRMERLYTSGAAQWQVSTQQNLSVGWIFIVWELDASSNTNDAVVYHDNAAQTMSELAAPSGTGPNNTAGVLWLGNRPSDAARVLGGGLAWVSVYSRVLNATEKNSVRDEGALYGDANLLFYTDEDCDFDVVTSTAGTITGTTTNGADNPPVSPPSGAQTITAAHLASTFTLHAATLSVASGAQQIDAAHIASTFTLHSAGVSGSLAAPTNLVATPVSSTQINLSWDDNSTNETAYVVERSPNGTDTWAVLTEALAVDSESYSDLGLTPGTQYFYRVKSRKVG